MATQDQTPCARRHVGASAGRLRYLDMALIVALVAASYLPSMWTELQHDEALWLCATRGWQGPHATPYEALFDNKPIMVYLCYSAALSAFSDGLQGERLLKVLVNAVTALSLAHLVSRGWGRTAGVAAGIAYPLSCTRLGPLGLVTEDLQAMFAVLAVGVWYRAAERPSRALLLCAGAAWGLAALSKQPALLPLLLFGAMTARGTLRAPGNRSRLADTVVLICGGLAGPLLFILWLWQAGGPAVAGEWIQASLPFSGSHAGIIGLGRRVQGLAKMTLVISTLAPVLFLATWAALQARQDRRLWPIVVWAGAELAAYLLPGTGYPHQLIPFAAASAVLVGVGLAGLSAAIGDRRALLTAVMVTAVLFHAGSMLFCVQQPQQLGSPILRMKSSLGLQTSLAPPSDHEIMGRWIASRTDRSDRVIASPQALWYADRPFPGPHYTHALQYPTPLCDRWRAAVVDTVLQRPPKLVVARPGDRLPPCPALRRLVERDYHPLALPPDLSGHWQVYEHVGS